MKQAPLALSPSSVLVVLGAGLFTLTATGLLGLLRFSALLVHCAEFVSPELFAVTDHRGRQ